MKKNIQLGQVWLARSNEMPGVYWPFEIIAAIAIKGKRFFIGIKTLLPEPNSDNIYMFDEDGREVYEDRLMAFQLYRRSKKKPTYTDIIRQDKYPWGDN